jgi:hypothetical protein
VLVIAVRGIVNVGIGIGRKRTRVVLEVPEVFVALTIIVYTGVLAFTVTLIFRYEAVVAVVELGTVAVIVVVPIKAEIP